MMLAYYVYQSLDQRHYKHVVQSLKQGFMLLYLLDILHFVLTCYQIWDFFFFPEVDICVTLAVLELTEIFLPLAPKCWD